ncbi:hypothetical protein N7520_004893 [Penicillium odoratum]|uniref:uncharacterized protein n=1 Tax=Penicillium odoratum TaxID=1167516 RepID=UPI00254861C2|nr:uncharacterized protein N7520_004893 [Penicillium odoratum]KAJ5765334.1 hypothetical protein N7520_004893 [Penicillium odoratum]
MFRVGRFTCASMRQVRWNSTATTPPMMATLRADLKTAMRAKDTARLNVLRALISETNNAAKTSQPFTTDLQLLSLIRKRSKASQEAAELFAKEDRADLKAKEDEQVTILEEYASQIKTMPIEELEAIIALHIAKIQANGDKPRSGPLIGALFVKGGPLDGKPVNKADVPGLVNKLLGSN